MLSPRPTRWFAALLASVTVALVPGATWSSPARAGSPAIMVDTTQDSFDGSCGDGDCSIRDAVRSAPAGTRVLVPPGFYPLSIAGRGGVGVGSIELRRGIRIVGVGEPGAFLDATDLGGPAFLAAPRQDGVRSTISNLTVFGSRNASRRGGAIRVSGGSLRLHDVTITGGRAERGGGIGVVAGASLVLRDTLVIGNEATTGGGIWNAGILTVESSAVVSNLAGRGGGIAAAPGSTTSIDGTTIAANTVTDTGGGIRIAGAAEIVATTIGDNEAAHGGGIAIAAGDTELGSSIVSGNRADSSRQCSGRIESLGDNVEQGHGCRLVGPGDLENADVLLRRLGPYGGPTPTMALSVRSPAADLAGDCGGRDQRGAPRDRRCDAGAYEIVRCLGRPVNIVGTPDEDELSGGRGRDVFLGMAGGDEFQGSIGRDRACGGPGGDLLIAGPGNDRFAGEAGDDRVKGEAGRDLLYAGPGRDQLVGGPGRDRCELDAADRDPRGCERPLPGSDARAPRAAT